MTEEKKYLMDYLHMKTDDIKDAANIEKLFCLALFQEDPKLTNRVLTRFIEYRNILIEKEN